MIHHLSDRDTVARKATCSECGPVKIAKSGTGWVCAEKAKATVRAYKKRNPERDRQGKNTHRLSWKDPVTRAGVCAVDGAVDIVPWGRGWICSTRAKELGRVTEQDKPLGNCRDCFAESEGDARRLMIWLRADGTCPRCSDPYDLNAEFAKDRADARLLEGWADIAGMSIVGANADPYLMPDFESAVPGWHTIGARA